MIPWKDFEPEYAAQMNEDIGAPGKSFRTALGGLLIKERLGTSDEETVEQIRENPYLQYFLGLSEYSDTSAFASSSMVHFRKRISLEMVGRINQQVLVGSKKPDNAPSLNPVKFIYCLRIFDQFRQVPISLAILCDDSLSWRPHEYGAIYPDTRLHFEFGTAKLLNWRDRMNELESSNNPFATVVMAHLKVIETKRDVDQRRAWKFRLTRGLYEKGYDRQEILDLYRFINWILVLPREIEREFWQELQSFEEERKVTYVTNAERFGIEKGERSLILRQLARRVGTLPANVEA